jgi:hypothetical protein
MAHFGEKLAKSDRLLVRGSQFVYGHDVQRTDGHCELVFANHHDHLRRNGDEIPMRNGQAPPVRETKGEGGETILKPLLNLLDHGATLLATVDASKQAVS